MNNARRKFLASISMLAASFSFPIDAFSFHKKKKLKIVLVGTGIRGTSFWGRRLVEQYSEVLEFVGLCDSNIGRLKYAKNFKGNLLYIHGTGDDNVHYQNAELLANELIKHKKVFYMVPYPNRSHSIREDSAYPHLTLMFTDFLRKNCPPGAQ